MCHRTACLLIVLAAWVPVGCGDKIDPGTPSTDTAPTGGSETTDSNTTVSQAGDGNMSSDGNTTGSTTTNSNTTTTSGNSNGQNSNTSTTTGGSGTTSTGLCGTTQTTISYAQNVQPVIAAACSKCHGQGMTPPTMTTYANTMSAFTNNGAQSQVDSRAMPQGGSLTTNQLCILDHWSAGSYAQ